MKKRLIVRSFLITFFVLANITNLVTLPFTNAKYLKEENFAYETSMYDFNPTFNVVNYPTTLEDGSLYVNYKISFARNKMNYPGEHDYYTFYARINNQKNTCVVSANPKALDDTGSATLTGNDNVSVLKVDVKCDITALTGSIPIHFNVVEQVDDDQVLLVGDTIKTYYNNDLLTYIRHDIDEGSVFDAWDAYRHKMRNYIDATFLSNADFQNGVQLKGITYDVATFTVNYDDNFVAYATTFADYSSVNYTTAFFYNSLTNIDEDFIYYLKTYYSYSDEYIGYIADFIMQRTGKDNLKDALLEVLNLSTSPVIGLTKNTSSNPPLVGLNFMTDLICNAVNIIHIADGLPNYFFVDSASSARNIRSRYNVFAPLYGYSSLVDNALLRESLISITNPVSRLYILDSIDDVNNKLLVNIYNNDDVLSGNDLSKTYSNNYMSVTNLNGSPLTIKISNKDNFEFYDLVNGDGSSVTYSDISDIITAIGDYVYGVDNYTYTSNVDEDGYMNVTYTLNS